jgi:large subunit ribosomal protein L24e
MTEKRTCSFCGSDIEPGTGKLFVKKDSTALYFCKMKCQKNMLKLGRIPRRVRWTKQYLKKTKA